MNPDAILLTLWAAVLSLPFIGFFNDEGKRKKEERCEDLPHGIWAVVVAFAICVMFWATVIAVLTKTFF